MTLDDAILIVAADQRKSYPNMGVTEAVRFARNRIVVDDASWVPGVVVLDGDPGDPTYDAYVMVLTADEDEMPRLV